MPYDELWTCLRAPKRMWTYSAADQALMQIYAALGLQRPRDVDMQMWKRWRAHHKSGQEK